MIMVPPCNPPWRAGILYPKGDACLPCIWQSHLRRLHSIIVKAGLSGGTESGSTRSESNNLRRLDKSRRRYWVHALVVGLALTGEIHLFSVEILHHHDAAVAVCRIGHEGASYLHASQDVSPLCPLCQLVRSSSVRPAVRSLIANPCSEAAYHLIARNAKYSYRLAQTLLARSPPLS